MDIASLDPRASISEPSQPATTISTPSQPATTSNDPMRGASSGTPNSLVKVVPTSTEMRETP